MSRIVQVIVLLIFVGGVGLVFAFFSQDATAAPSVSWSQTSASETLLPGESRTIALTVTAQEAVPNATLWVVPELEPYVSVTPTSIGPLAKGETTSLSLPITAPIDAIPHTATGTVQLRQTNEPNKTIAQPLPVSVEVVWPRAEGLPGGVSFSYPTFGQPSQVESRLGEDGSIGVRILSTPSSSGAILQYIVGIVPNPRMLSLTDWFREEIDLSGAILSSGGYIQRTLSNDVQFFIVTGEIPSAHLECCGPIENMYAITPDRTKIITVATGHEHRFGTSYEQVQELYVAMLESMAFP